MKKTAKKIMTVVLTVAMLVCMACPVMADNTKPQVFVNFICGGQVTGKLVPYGSNVTAPAAPIVGGYTFCGYDKSLRNVTANTTYVAVYEITALGDAAIKAKKASLPTPAITATTVADPNAMPSAIPTNVPASAVTVDLAAIQAALAANAALAQQQQAALAAQQAAALAAQQKAATPAPAIAPAPAPAPAPAVVAPGVPSWVVGLEGVTQAGAVTAYNYLKNTKGLDDATIQANWGAFMHHYAGHGVAGW